MTGTEERHWLVSAEGRREAIEAAAAALDALDPWPMLSLATFERDRILWHLEALAADEAGARRLIELIHDAAPDLAAAAEPAPEADWIALSLAGLPAIHAGRFVIAGAHAADCLSPGKKAILIEASEAFGTGHHGTTRGCLLALDRLARRGPVGRTLDIGTGSGILSIAAAKAHAKGLWASEIDPIAAGHARDNARRNRARGVCVRVCSGLNRADLRQAGRFDLVFANILFRPLVRLAPGIAAALRPRGRVVLSGLLNAQAPLVRLAYESRGLSLEHRGKLEGWTTLVMRKGAGPGR